MSVSLRDRLNRQRPLFGTHVGLESITISDLYARLGYDYLWIDMEHTALRSEQVLSHIIAANGQDTAAVVRVPWNDPVLLKPILEMGPDAVVIPMVCSREEAEQAVAACRYPPAGIRGWGPRRAIGYGLTDKDDYLNNVESRTMCLLQIEHVRAIDDLYGITRTEGADGFIIGPMDLLASGGLLHGNNEDQLDKWIDEIIGAVHEAGKIAGISIGHAKQEQLTHWISRGMDMISMGSDTRYLLKGAQENLEMLRESCGSLNAQGD